MYLADGSFEQMIDPNKVPKQHSLQDAFDILESLVPNQPAMYLKYRNDCEERNQINLDRWKSKR